MKSTLSDSLSKLEKWIESHDFKGYEPFDGLSSPLYKLVSGNLLLERLLQQSVRQSPVNLRPFLGVKPLHSTKGRGYIASGYLKMYEHTGDPIYRTKVEDSLQWLVANKSPLYEHFAWGNHFNYSSRAGRIPIFEPTIVWTSLIGQVFLDAYSILKSQTYLDIAKSVCHWIMSLPRENTSTGTCLSYVAFTQSSIHNSNMLGAAMLARTTAVSNIPGALDLAKKAMAYSCADQLNDGAWNYGYAAKYHWIDNFHTGYNLNALKCYIDNTGDHRFLKHLEKGLEFFTDHFFEPSGRPKYYHNRAYPIDIQCASQAIDTLLYYSGEDPSLFGLAERVANWTIHNMQDKTGYFYYRILPFKKVKIPMIHWGQATMFKALAFLLKEKYVSNHE